MSDSLWPHELQHARLPCPSLSPGVCSNSHPLSQWCHPTTSPSVTFLLPSVFPRLRVFSKEIKPINPKGSQPWLFIGRSSWSWSWCSSTLATWYEEPTHWKRPWLFGKGVCEVLVNQMWTGPPNPHLPGQSLAVMASFKLHCCEKDRGLRCYSLRWNSGVCKYKPPALSLEKMFKRKPEEKTYRLNSISMTHFLFALSFQLLLILPWTPQEGFLWCFPFDCFAKNINIHLGRKRVRERKDIGHSFLILVLPIWQDTLYSKRGCYKICSQAAISL